MHESQIYSHTWTCTQCNNQHWVPVMATPEATTGLAGGWGIRRWFKGGGRKGPRFSTSGTYGPTADKSATGTISSVQYTMTWTKKRGITNFTWIKFLIVFIHMIFYKMCEMKIRLFSKSRKCRDVLSQTVMSKYELRKLQRLSLFRSLKVDLSNSLK